MHLNAILKQLTTKSTFSASALWLVYLLMANSLQHCIHVILWHKELPLCSILCQTVSFSQFPTPLLLFSLCLVLVSPLTGAYGWLRWLCQPSGHRLVARIFYEWVGFNKETDQTRQEVQLSRGKIWLSETALRTWIFLNFLNYKLTSISLKTDYFLKIKFLRMADINVTF